MLFGLAHFLAVVGAENGGLEAAKILLVNERVSGFLTINAVIFAPLSLNGGGRHGARVVNRQDF